MPKANIIKQVGPIYPEDAIIAKVEGIMIIQPTTDEQGKFLDTKILRSIPLLDKAALAAVKKWIFEPSMINGKPRPAIFPVTVLISLLKYFSRYEWIALRGADHYDYFGEDYPISEA